MLVLDRMVPIELAEKEAQPRREEAGKRIRRGIFVSVDDLKTAIQEFLAAWNEAPKPLVWTATVDSIVEKLNRCRQTLETIKPGCTQPRMRKNKGK